MNCGPLEEEYDKRREAWMHDSINEFKLNEQMEENGQNALFAGPM